MADYNQVITELVAMLSLDPHPSTDIRAQSMIRKLDTVDVRYKAKVFKHICNFHGKVIELVEKIVDKW